MTPAARVQAAIEILDHWLSGEAALEQSLTGWARRCRFAGSKDRAAVRDYVFDAVRRLRSDAARGGEKSGRGLMLGSLIRQKIDPDTVFGIGGHAPAALEADERSRGREPAEGAELLDIPDWLWPIWTQSLGASAAQTAHVWQDRAPVHVRVNVAKCDLKAAQSVLARDGIDAEPHPTSPWALTVMNGARRIKTSSAYLDGLIELQDAASQAVVAAIPDLKGARVLDYCAGGGGKALAAAAAGAGEVFAHDINPKRMRDLPERAKRSGHNVSLLKTADLQSAGEFDIVICDAPCSGSGSWRRAPEGKWTLTKDRLDDLTVLQRAIILEASTCLASDGTLVYATCSLLMPENQAVTCDIKGLEVCFERQWGVADASDGLYTAHLTRQGARNI